MTHEAAPQVTDRRPRAGGTLRRVVRAELTKIARRPAFVVLALVAAAAHLYLARIQPYLTFLELQRGLEDVPGWAVDSVMAQMRPARAVDAFLMSMLPFCVAAAAVFGALLSGSEHAWKTVRTVHTQGPRRGLLSSGRVIAAAGVLLAFAVTVLAVTLAVAVALAGLHGLGTTLPTAGRLAAALGTGWLLLLLPCLAGMVLAAVLRNGAAAIAVCLLWLTVVQGGVTMAGMGTAFADVWHSIDPMANAASAAMLLGVPGVAEGATVFQPVPPARGVAVTGLYVAALAALAAWLPGRGDITA